MLFMVALACGPIACMADDPFRFWDPSMRGEESATRSRPAVELTTGHVVDLCNGDVTSDECTQTVRALMGGRSAYGACPLQDWARKFVARAHRSSEYLTYWRAGPATNLMTIVADEAEYDHGFSCED